MATEKTEIINLTEASGVSDNDYVMIDNPTQGVRKYKAINFIGGEPTLTTKSITANGTYEAVDDNAQGYSEVTVNVASSPDWYMYDGKVAQASPQEYISSPLLKRMTAGNYVVSINDSGSYYSAAFHYSGSGSVTITRLRNNNDEFNFSGRLTITPTTAGLTEYSGSYRNIYCKISKIDDSQIYS